MKGSEGSEEERGQSEEQGEKGRINESGWEGCSLRRDEFAPRADSGHARSARDFEGGEGRPIGSFN